MVSKFLAGAAALGVSCAAGAATVDVFVYNFAFSVNMPGGPVADPVIDVGDTVRWVFLQGFHNVHSSDGQAESFVSEFFQGDGTQTFEHTFTTAGDYAYYCEIHGDDNGMGGFEGMGAFVHVVPAPGAGALALGVGLLTAPRRRR